MLDQVNRLAIVLVEHLIQQLAHRLSNLWPHLLDVLVGEEIRYHAPLVSMVGGIHVHEGRAVFCRLFATGAHLRETRPRALLEGMSG